MTAQVIALVPAAEDMDDETIVRHINARHCEDVGGAKLSLDGPLRLGTVATLSAYRAFHSRLHALSTPGQYDHEHDDPSANA